MKKIVSTLCIAMLFLCGCHSDLYYQNDAVARARKFMLQNVDDLSTAQINFVRFNPPVLLHSPVGGSGREDLGMEKSSFDRHQVCVTWMIPGKDQLYMVYGVSTGRMRDWEPNRVLKRNYNRNRAVLPAAAKKCVEFARNNFFTEMSAGEINIIRFTMPYLHAAEFELNFNPDGSLSSEETAKLRQESRALRQYALLWKLGKDRNFVCIGLGKAGFENWKLMTGGVFSDGEMNEFLREQFMTPDDYTNPFPAAKESGMEKKEK